MTLHWQKLGLVYGPDGSSLWAKTHAMVPTPLQLDERVVRVFVTMCDANYIGRTGYVDVDANNPTRVIGVSKSPVLDVGEPGTFDENGVLTCSVVRGADKTLYMYYVGFELGTKIRYRLLTGLAISKDNGETFQRVRKTPVLERSDQELYFRGGPYCLIDHGKFKLWYVAGSQWTTIDGKPMPVYDVRYLESDNGIDWLPTGKVCIDITEADEHGFGRPCVIPKGTNGYRMFYSVRRRSLGAYRLGYAESDDGIHWRRMDEKMNLDVSPDSFDSKAIMYATPLEIAGKLYVFYNGNDFGKEGFAVARLESER